MTENNVILVDKQDNAIGTMEKMEAHVKAVLHRAISVFIVNSQGDMLQQRTLINIIQKVYGPTLVAVTLTPAKLRWRQAIAV